MRKKIVAGNWKMNKVVADACSLAAGVKEAAADIDEVEVVLCPPFTALAAVADIVRGTRIGLGAQNMHWEASGAYTGEVSPGMLKGVGCGYVILGHSERRAYFGETNEGVNKKAKAAIASGLTPIVCVGETLEDREGGKTEAVVRDQVEKSLAGLANDLEKAVVAYEPVWAIGTGRTATPEQAQEVHAFIRGLLAEMTGDASAGAVRIQYGGSMKPQNAGELMSQPDIDGGLIGGAALDPKSFVDIVTAARNV